MRKLNRLTRNLVRRLPVLADEYMTARIAYPGVGSLRRFRAAKECRLDLVPPGVPFEGLFVDVGANVGDWTAAVLDVAPHAQVLAIEPAPGPFGELSARFSTNPRVATLACAVGDRRGRANFNLTADSTCSSLLQPRDMGRVYGGPGWELTASIQVEVRPLDDLIERDVTVLKLDVQGGEQQSLAGARRTLERTMTVLIEVTFASHYYGDATFPSLHEDLTMHGFELVGLSAPRAAPSGQLLWLDACYRNSSFS